MAEIDMTIESTERLEKRCRNMKIMLVLAGIGMLIVMAAVYFGMNQYIALERKALLGAVYAQNEDAGKYLADALLTQNVNVHNAESGIKAMEKYGYTKYGFSNVQNQYPVNSGILIGLIAVILVLGLLMLVFWQVENGFSIWEIEKKKFVTVSNRLDGMNAALERKNEQMKTFIENVAHQIRTPISFLFLAVEDIPENEKRESCIASLNRVKNMVNCLLKISRLEAGAVVMEKSDYRLCDILTEICEDYARVQVELITEQVDNMDEIMVHIDEDWFTESLSNIINNGCEHSDGSEPVKVTVEKDNQFIKVYVSNKGVPMAKEDIPYIFDRFYTAGNVLLSHTGIGLNMAQLAIRQMDGDIKLHVKEDRTEFVIMLRGQALTEKIGA